ncbi:MAG: putative transposase [Streptosporangiaceae bacterium]
MLTQVPLPLLPRDAAEIAPGVGVVAGPDGGGVVWVHGLATFAWDAGDEAARRLAAVQLVQLNAATQVQVAQAFGVIPVSVWRWAKALAGGGVAGLVPAAKGPQRASKLTPQVIAQIRELDRHGAGKAAIAAAAGVSESSVRSVLRPARPAADGVPAGQDPAGTSGSTDTGSAGTDSAGTGPAGTDAGVAEPEVLPVLPDPVPRDGERALARFGLLGEGAVPAFTPGARYPLAGLLLALPPLAQSGLPACARQVYGRLRNGFYGLEGMLIVLVFMALLREARAEGATRIPPAALGRVPVLDRAPEVKTIRRKLAGLAAAGKAADLQLALARHHAAASPGTLGFLYTDGHTRAYFGKRDIQKMHVTRLKFPAPATEETWVTGSAGDPLLVVMAQPSSSLAAQIRDLLPALRDITGPAAKPVLCFDRGGWSPALFAGIADAGFDLLTYRKNDTGKDIPDLPGDAFSTASWPGDDGRPREYELADTTISLTVSDGEHKGRVLQLRQVTRRKPGDTRQVHILTTRPAAALPAAGVIYRMTSRWREENYFRYGRAHFALDALDTYAVTPEDPARLVPNPAKKTAAAAVSTAKKDLAQAEAARQRKLDALRQPAPGTAVVITNQALARLDAPVDAARRDLAAAQAAARAVPAKIPLAGHNPDMVKLDTETKLITHAIRMAACNTETILARALNSCYARAGDEAYALIREALHASGDITISGTTLHIRLDPLSAPRRTRALAALCEQLNTTPATYPGTTLTLHYDVKEHPATT